jgi:hypothetical protein
MTTVVLSPLRKQGDVSKIPAAPTVVLLQGSKHFSDGHVIAYAGLKHFSDSHVGMYTGLRHFPARHVSAQLHPPIVHLDPLLASIKGRSRAFMQKVARENELTNRLTLSLSRTLVTPTTSTPPLAWDNTSRVFLLVFHLAPTHLARTRSDKFTRRSRDPPGSKRRQLARQVGACYVLTNNFPLSSRWVVSSVTPGFQGTKTRART